MSRGRDDTAAPMTFRVCLRWVDSNGRATWWWAPDRRFPLDNVSYLRLFSNKTVRHWASRVTRERLAFDILPSPRDEQYCILQHVHSKLYVAGTTTARGLLWFVADVEAALPFWFQRRSWNDLPHGDNRPLHPILPSQQHLVWVMHISVAIHDTSKKSSQSSMELGRYAPPLATKPANDLGVSCTRECSIILQSEESANAGKIKKRRRKKDDRAAVNGLTVLYDPSRLDLNGTFQCDSLFGFNRMTKAITTSNKEDPRTIAASKKKKALAHTAAGRLPETEEDRVGTDTDVTTEYVSHSVVASSNAEASVGIDLEETSADEEYIDAAIAKKDAFVVFSRRRRSRTFFQDRCIGRKDRGAFTCSAPGCDAFAVLAFGVEDPVMSLYLSKQHAPVATSEETANCFLSFLECGIEGTPSRCSVPVLISLRRVERGARFLLSPSSHQKLQFRSEKLWYVDRYVRGESSSSAAAGGNRWEGGRTNGEVKVEKEEEEEEGDVALYFEDEAPVAGEGGSAAADEPNPATPVGNRAGTPIAIEYIDCDAEEDFEEPEEELLPRIKVPRQTPPSPSPPPSPCPPSTLSPSSPSQPSANTTMKEEDELTDAKPFSSSSHNTIAAKSAHSEEPEGPPLELPTVPLLSFGVWPHNERYYFGNHRSLSVLPLTDMGHSSSSTTMTAAGGGGEPSAVGTSRKRLREDVPPPPLDCPYTGLHLDYPFSLLQVRPCSRLGQEQFEVLASRIVPKGTAFLYCGPRIQQDHEKALKLTTAMAVGNQGQRIRGGNLMRYVNHHFGFAKDGNVAFRKGTLVDPQDHGWHTHIVFFVATRDIEPGELLLAESYGPEYDAVIERVALCDACYLSVDERAEIAERCASSSVRELYGVPSPTNPNSSSSGSSGPVVAAPFSSLPYHGCYQQDIRHGSLVAVRQSEVPVAYSSIPMVFYCVESGDKANNVIRAVLLDATDFPLVRTMEAGPIVPLRKTHVILFVPGWDYTVEVEQQRQHGDDKICFHVKVGKEQLLRVPTSL